MAGRPVTDRRQCAMELSVKEHTMKSGRDHTESLRDGREIYIDGRKVEDVTTHPAFRNVVRSVTKLFDFASAPENRDLMTCETPEGGRANRIWELPTSVEQLRSRRSALEAWTALHAGFMGRAPDHVASCISGMFMGIEQFEAYDPK